MLEIVRLPWLASLFSSRISTPPPRCSSPDPFIFLLFAFFAFFLAGSRGQGPPPHHHDGAAGFATWRCSSRISRPARPYLGRVDKLAPAPTNFWGGFPFRFVFVCYTQLRHREDCSWGILLPFYYILFFPLPFLDSCPFLILASALTPPDTHTHSRSLFLSLVSLHLVSLFRTLYVTGVRNWTPSSRATPPKRAEIHHPPPTTTARAKGSSSSSRPAPLVPSTPGPRLLFPLHRFRIPPRIIQRLP